ncbi:hemerythrin domain-containing protein [Peptoniphilus equinus]|uniref:Hemerythrin domain-containing protein n=1 Tax=Peptoniphilus equinus TaxID=3016343 RepID=A0ABY7QUJ1_9FIRM|nr:hemerythrin domain-containing protein [Peptoniphilus equinus]WBW50448.1 hemerythrin domain-containing protein [Peptoniphilus equinus]
MKSIEVLMTEHEAITAFVDRIEVECLRILEVHTVNTAFFRAAISYIREYADGIHHKKEEDILFRYMEDTLGTAAQKLVRSGMLVEHQLARSYCLGMEEYLNAYEATPNRHTMLQLLTHAMSYVNLLRQHIEKENGVVYPFAEAHLEEVIQQRVEDESAALCESESAYLARKKELEAVLYGK